MENCLNPKNFKYCQPIDTWVKQVALKVGIIKSENDDVETIKIVLLVVV